MGSTRVQGRVLRAMHGGGGSPGLPGRTNPPPSEGVEQSRRGAVQVAHSLVEQRTVLSGPHALPGLCGPFLCPRFLLLTAHFPGPHFLTVCPPLLSALPTSFFSSAWFPLEVGLSSIFPQLFPHEYSFLSPFHPLFTLCLGRRQREKQQDVSVWPTGTELRVESRPLTRLTCSGASKPGKEGSNPDRRPRRPL